MYVALVKFDGHIGAMCDRDNSTVAAFKTKKEGEGVFESGYNAGHTRSYEGSMSACMNFIQFQPKVIKVKDGVELQTILGVGPYHRLDCRAISGFMSMIVAKKPNPDLEKIFETGSTPRLISEDTFPDEGKERTPTCLEPLHAGSAVKKVKKPSTSASMRSARKV